MMGFRFKRREKLPAYSGNISGQADEVCEMLKRTTERKKMLDIQKIGTRLGNIKDLPKEIRDRLHPVREKVGNHWILDAIKNEFGGCATIDELVVYWYRKTGKVCDRKYIHSSVGWFKQKGLLFGVKQGVYCTDRKLAKMLREENI